MSKTEVLDTAAEAMGRFEKGKRYGSYLDWLNDLPKRQPEPVVTPITLKELWFKYNNVKRDYEAVIAQNLQVDEASSPVRQEIREIEARIHRCKDDKNTILSLLTNSNNILDAPENQKRLTEINALIETLGYQKTAKEKQLAVLQNQRVGSEDIVKFEETLVANERVFLRAVINDFRVNLLLSKDIKRVCALYLKTERVGSPELIFKHFFRDTPRPLSEKDAESVCDEILAEYSLKFTEKII